MCPSQVSSSLTTLFIMTREKLMLKIIAGRYWLLYFSGLIPIYSLPGPIQTHSLLTNWEWPNDPFIIAFCIASMP